MRALFSGTLYSGILSAPESHRWVWPALVLGGYLLGYTGVRWFKLDRQFKATLWACLVSITATIAFVGVDITLAYFIPLYLFPVIVATEWSRQAGI